MKAVRSALLRLLSGGFLRRHRAQETDARYERAYAGVEQPLGEDFDGWEEEGARSPDPRRQP